MSHQISFHELLRLVLAGIRARIGDVGFEKLEAQRTMDNGQISNFIEPSHRLIDPGATPQGAR